MALAPRWLRAADIRHDWFVVDAAGQVLGRLASDVARVLSGKHRPNWVANLDTGDFVVVTNAERVRLTGRKTDDKVYHHHSGYPGGMKSVAGERPAGQVPRAAGRRGRSGDAPEDEARTQAVQEAEGLPRGLAPPSGAAAEAVEAAARTAKAKQEESWRSKFSTGPRDGARRPWRASGWFRGRGRSR